MLRRYDRHKAERKPTLPLWRIMAFPALLLVLILAGVIAMFPRSQGASAAGGGNWTTYLADDGHSDFNKAETIINPGSAPNLKLHWSTQAGGYISTNYVTAQPVEANGTIYWGSWDGNEHATNLNGQQVWLRGLGYTYNSQCNSLTGVASTATAATVTIGKTKTNVLLVGGGDQNLYSLNAATGAIIWHTRLGSYPNNFIWSSPTIYNGSIYIGLASFGDCPATRGKLIELNETTGAIEHLFNTVPQGCTGGGVWGSPTIDTSSGILYFATGNAGTCSSGETLTNALIAVRTSDLKLLGSWQVPSSQGTPHDTSSTPTLFQGTIGGTLRQLVGIINKNGTYYAFDRAAISSGPLWNVQVAGTGGGCGPRCGDGSISPSGWDGTSLYVAGGQTNIGGNSCKGSLRALNPSSGATQWADCFNDGPVLGAVSLVPGVAVVGEGNKMVVVATSDGHTLFSYTDTNSGSNFYSAAAISNGVLYIGNFDGYLYAFGT